MEIQAVIGPKREAAKRRIFSHGIEILVLRIVIELEELGVPEVKKLDQHRRSMGLMNNSSFARKHTARIA